MLNVSEYCVQFITLICSSNIIFSVGKATHKEESLKIMGDVASGTGSFVAQVYLKEVLQNFFSTSPAVRLTALSVIATVLRQGLTHPVHTVAYLIAMQTDCDPATRVKAEAQLQEIDTKFPGFINVNCSFDGLIWL